MLNWIQTLSPPALLFLFIGCSADLDLKDEEIVVEIFSQDEAQDLQSIHDFFSTRICDWAGSGSEDPSVCFEIYLDSMKIIASTTGTYLYPIDQSETSELLNNFDSDIFNEIWIRSEYSRDESSYERIQLNSDGKYFEFLEKLAEEDSNIAEYRYNYLSAGTMSASLVADFMHYPEKFNVQDSRVRLVVAVHYMTNCYTTDY